MKKDITIRIVICDEKGTLPIQPIPRLVLSTPIRTTRGWLTALTRTWAAGDTARCRLCPSGTCVAREGVCMLVVPGRLEAREATLFDTAGMTRGPAV